RRGYGEMIWFGDYRAKFQVRRLRVFPSRADQVISRKGGRRPLAIWGTAKLIAMRYLDHNGCPTEPGDQAAFEKYMSDWLGTKMGDHLPAESTIRNHCREWILAFPSWREAKAD